MTGRKLRNHITVHPTAVLAVILLVGVVAYFLLIAYKDVKYATNQIMNTMNDIQDNLNEDIIPIYTRRTNNELLMRQLYVFSNENIEIDGNVEDWNIQLSKSVKEEELTPVDKKIDSISSHLWLNDIFEKNVIPWSQYTPHAINRIQLQKETNLQDVNHMPNLILQFGHSSSKGLYILAHMVNLGPEQSVSLRLTVRYSGPKKRERQFAIAPEENGDLRIYEVTPNEPSETTTSGFDYNRASPQEAFGRWEDDFFELALPKVGRSEAILLAAYVYKGNDTVFRTDWGNDADRQRVRPLFSLKSEDFLSLQGPAHSHTMNKLLEHFQPYAVSRGSQILLSSSQTSEENSDTSMHWLLKLIYRLSSSFNRIGPCHSQGEYVTDGVCFVYTPSYSLIQKRPLEVSGQKAPSPSTQSSTEADQQKYDDVVMITAKQKIESDVPGGFMVIPVIVLLVILLAFFDQKERERRHVYRELEQNQRGSRTCP